MRNLRVYEETSGLVEPMDISVKDNNLQFGDAMGPHIESQLDSATAKYYNHVTNMAGILFREGQEIYAGVSIHSDPSTLMTQNNGEAGRSLRHHRQRSGSIRTTHNCVINDRII